MAHRVFLVLQSYPLCCSLKAANASDFYTRAVKPCAQKYKTRGESGTQRGRSPGLPPTLVSPAHPGEAAGERCSGFAAGRGLRPSSKAPSWPAKTRFHRATNRASLPPPLSRLLRGGEARPRTSAQGQRAKAVSDELGPALPVSMLCRARPGSQPWLHPLPLPPSRPHLHCGPAREKH